MRKIALLAGCVTVFTACGALFNGGPAQVNFTTDPSGAEVWIDGSRRGVTPIVIPLQKNDDYAVEFKLEGYEPVTATITKRVSAGYVVLDVLGGLIPIIIDAATGSWYVLNEDHLHRSLQQRTAQGTLTPEQLERVLAGESFDEVMATASSR